MELPRQVHMLSLALAEEPSLESQLLNGCAFSDRSLADRQNMITLNVTVLFTLLERGTKG